ncbi:MAG: ferrochelatase [Bacteroidota bacterium]
MSASTFAPTLLPPTLQAVRRKRACVRVGQGSRVGVVLLNLGGPTCLEQTDAFVERVFADLHDVRATNSFIWGRWTSGRQRAEVAAYLKAAYEAIGGRSPLNRDMRAMARALQRALRRTEWVDLGVSFRVYEALRYGTPSIEDTIRQMQLDEIDEVVLLPLCPRMDNRSDSVGLRHWLALSHQQLAGPWQPVLADDYANHPAYTEAVNDRIDEALGRFPRHVRDEVMLVFAAHAHTKASVAHVEALHQRIMHERGDNRATTLSIQKKRRPTSWVTDGTAKALKKCAKAGETAVLLVPLTFVTDHIETLHGLDVQVRSQAHAWGIEHVEVTAGLNNHATFIRALEASVLTHIEMAEAERDRLKQGQYAHAG